MKTAHQTHALDRREALRAEQTYRLLASRPNLQTEAVAEHYCKLAALAIELRKLISLSRHGEGSPELDRCIRSLTDAIIKHHLEDFGIELSWKSGEQRY